MSTDRRPTPDASGTDIDTSAKDLVAKGISELQMQDLVRAENCFRDALAKDGALPDACHLLAVTLMQRNKDLEEAEQLINRALEARPDEPVFHNSLGTALWNKGEVDAAKTQFDKAIALRPDYVDALYNVGNVYRKLRRYSDALQAYSKTIEQDPSYTRAYNDMGLVLYFLGKHREAVEQFTLALDLDPMRHDYYLNLANAHQSLGEFDDARLAIENALALEPDDPKAYNNLGTVYHQQEINQLAEEAFRRALDLDPESVQAAYNLGVVLHELKQFEESASMFDKVLSANEEWPSAYVNKGNALHMLKRFDEAIDSYEKAVDLHPRYAVAHLSLAATYRRMCLLDKAVQCFDRAIALRPDYPVAHFGKALALLKAGDMNAGWRHYEWRFEVSGKGFNLHPDLRHPEWGGQDIRGKSLMVIGEQGLGDIIHFVRYLRPLKEKCRSITFSCASSLIPLLEGMKEIDTLVDRAQPWSVSCDYYINLLSLPRIFNTSVDTIPCDVPYLFAEEASIEQWRGRLDGEKLNVGLVWTGNPDQAENEYRSIPLDMLAPLSDVPGTCYYSLQKGPGAEQLRTGNIGMEIIDYTQELNDFSDTAALVKALDLVITVDTSVAHLCGALNAPVWTMLWFAHCWRYLRFREDSPWYPSMRLFRQPEIDDWPHVIASIKTEIEYLARARSESNLTLH